MIKETIHKKKSSNQVNLENQGSDKKCRNFKLNFGTDMKQDWEIKKLGEVCRFINGRAFSQQELLKNGKYPVLRVGNFYTNRDWYYSDLELPDDKYCDKGDLLYAWSASFGPRIWDGEKVIYHYHIWKVEPNEKLIRKDFLFQLLEWDTEAIKTAHGTGTTMMHVGKGSIENRQIPLPPLPEQQRIVSILDEAFAAIAKAKTNAEQNLKNAKELFESYLQGVFEKKGDGWEEQLFENCFKLKSGDNLTAKNMTEGEYPVFGGNGIAGYHNEYNLSGSNVIIGRVGALCGNVRHINENIWLTDNAFKVVDFKFDFDHSFLTYLLNHKDLRSYARQAAQPVISNSSLKDVVLNFPKSKEDQQTIVRQLDALRAETQKLEAIYQQKLLNLEELKKSVLQKAFNGELKTEKLQIL